MKSRYCSASARIEIAVQVDLLPARQFEQKVERPLEAVDVDVQRRLARRALREFDRFEGQGIGHDRLEFVSGVLPPGCYERERVADESTAADIQLSQPSGVKRKYSSVLLIRP